MKILLHHRLFKFKIITSFVFFVLIFVYFLIPSVFAGGGGGGGGGGYVYVPEWTELSGYAWNENIGLISLNCSNDNSCATRNYKIEIDTKNKDGGYGSGDIRGRAWNDTVGYISFNDADLSGCPSGACLSRVIWYTGGGEFQGWAKVVGPNGNEVNDPIWISLTCENSGSCNTSDYSVRINSNSGVLSGFAWSGNTVYIDTIEPLGWIDFSSATANFASTFGCYFDNDDEGSRRVFWNEDQVLGNESGVNIATEDAASFKQGIIPKGFYELSLASFDAAHPDGEPSERWSMVWRTSAGDPFISSDAVVDLPDYADYGEFLVNEKIEITEHITDTANIRAVYYEAGDPIPFDNNIGPACAELRYTCPFDDAENRTIVQFTNGRTHQQYYDQPNLSRGGNTTDFATEDKDGNPINLMPGVYTVSLAGFDNHLNSNGNKDSQPEEQFLATFYDSPDNILVATSNASPDIPDDEDYMMAEVNTEDLLIEEQVGAIRAEHASSDTINNNSLHVLCAAIDRVGDLPNQCQIPDAPGRIKIQFTGDELRGGYEDPPLSISESPIVSGYYNLTLAGYDEHPDGDDDERLNLIFNPGSGWESYFEATPDFPDEKDYTEFNLGSGYLPEDFVFEDIQIANKGAGSEADIHPICAALDPVEPEESCPFAQIPGRYIVNFYENNDKIRGDHNPKFTTLTPVSYPVANGTIPAGVYEIRTATYEDAVDTQTNDRWHIVPYEVGSGVELAQTNNTPNYVGNSSEPLTQQIDVIHDSGDEYLLSAEADQFIARHVSWDVSGGSDPDSIYPLCTAFDFVAPLLQEGEGVTLVPASQGAQLSETVSIDWNIESPPGDLSCTFTSSPTDATWDSNSGSSPSLTGTHQVTINQTGGHIYMVDCTFPSGGIDRAEATINVPPQCSDGIDNDDDGFCDTEGTACDKDNDSNDENNLGDRGCLFPDGTPNPDDNDESDEEVCIVNGICETHYGENPFTCTLDCVVNDYLED